METAFNVLLVVCVVVCVVSIVRDHREDRERRARPHRRVSRQRLARLWIINRRPLDQELHRDRRD